MNEILFFIQISLIIIFALTALKLGKVALTAWVAVQALVANLFVIKQITLLNFDVTASDAFAIGSLLGLNFLQEYFDQDDAKKATWVCFFCMLFFVLASQIHLLYEPSFQDASHSAFVTILSPSLRLFIASIGVFFLVQRLDILFFGFLKRHLNKTSFTVRTTIALVVSQLLDTILFSFFGLYGIAASMLDIIIISFVVKLVIIFCFTSFIRYAKT